MNLKEIRKVKGISQAELAVLSGVPEADISRIEAGKHNPTIATLKKLADALQCELIIDFKPKQQ